MTGESPAEGRGACPHRVHRLGRVCQERQKNRLLLAGTGRPDFGSQDR